MVQDSPYPLLSSGHILEEVGENVPQLLAALRCSSFLKYKGACQHWLFSWSPCLLILDLARHNLRILKMLQQPGCSVGDKMSVAECGLMSHGVADHGKILSPHFPNKMQPAPTALKRCPHLWLHTQSGHLHFSEYAFRLSPDLILRGSAQEAEGEDARRLLSDLSEVHLLVGRKAGEGERALLLHLCGLRANGLWQSALWKHLDRG